MFKINLSETGPNYDELEKHFGISVPLKLQELLNKFGYGYSEKQELLVFGGKSASRPLIEWNEEIIETGIYPPPIEGGPIFLAENCIGIQYGFRIENKQIIYILFDPNSFESYVIGHTEEEFFNEIIVEEDTVTLDGEIYPLLEAKEALKPGFHLAPFISPMLGGSLEPDNWGLFPAKLHLKTSIAEYRATQNA